MTRTPQSVAICLVLLCGMLGLHAQLPQLQLSSQDILFLTESVSIRTISGGVTNLSQGDAVGFLSANGNTYRVTPDGVNAFDVPIEKLLWRNDAAARQAAANAMNAQMAAQLMQLEQLQFQKVREQHASTAISVIQATYGHGDRLVDVTNEIRKRVQAGQTSIRAGNDLAGDPAFGKVKTLTIQYSLVGGAPITESVREGGSIRLGEPSEHHETELQQQDVSKRSMQTASPTWRNPLDRGPYGGSWSSRDTGKWDGNPLERGPYDRTQDKNYTDGSGRTYWIDIRGHRHYGQ